MNLSRVGMRVLAGLLCVALTACVTTPRARTAQSVEVWATSRDGQRKLASLPALPLVPVSNDAAGAMTITVDPARRGQPMVGFGAAMTDSSAIVIGRLPARQRAEVMTDLFGRKGLGISFLRVPIGASDFSVEHYSLDDVPMGERDPDLAHFSLQQPRQHQIPALREARALNPDLTIMASPWSAPAWMKDTGSLIKGQLRGDAYGAYARYFVRYLDAMQHERLPVRYISVQNEPHFEPADYPGMRFDPPDRARFLKETLGPALEHRRQAVGVLEYDHNWDRPQDPMAVLDDPAAARHVAGVAWHCYGGDPGTMEQVRLSHPDKDVFLTECSGGEWTPDWGDALEWMTDALIITATRSGSRGTLLWNLALDENHGPHRGGCGNCRGVVTIDGATGAVTRNVEYYVLGQVSRFVPPGSRRISSEGEGAVRHVAFRTPTGRLVLLTHNATKAPVTVTVRIGGRQFVATLPKGEVMTFLWNEGMPRS
ncbi:MAG: hypothetical protein KGM49_10530 [Sphingomonadales bacterium]|nr:hypothetical protein [Sphingomonadales bacterium]